MLVCNYATRVTTEASPLVCELLHACSAWRTIADIRAITTAGGRLLPGFVERLVNLSLLEQSDRPADPRTLAMASLDAWNPEFGFFHSATKDVHFWSQQGDQAACVHRQGARRRCLRRSSNIHELRRFRLPPPAGNTPFADVLLARRTSRRYSSAPVTSGELATILALSIGVQQWAITATGEVPLKTSPSGGARHPTECYVVARAVDGLKAGIYHYRADRHVLERIRGAVPVKRMRAYVPESGYFASASAMVFFTAVFGRQQWRYPYSRAYRAALIEAGHVCQTFLLAATSLGLAPYCVLGLADTLVEQDLGIDGISESVLYCAGVGRPPRGTRWASLTSGTLSVRPNKRLLPKKP